MKTLAHTSKLLLLGLSISFTFAACSAVNNDVESLSSEDIELATQIISESVADESSGIVSSLYDAVSTVGSDGIKYSNNQAKAAPDDKNGRGRESNYSYDYNPDNGTHTLSYSREVSNNNFSKSISLLNTYIFKTTEDRFIAFPKKNKHLIESIDFTGNKSGAMSSRHRNSNFARIDTFAITGLHQTSNLVTIDGKHHGEGTASGMTSDSVAASRNFTVDIEFINIEMDKAVIEENKNLEEGITGTLSYKIVTNKTVGDQNVEDVIEGTIELDGDGTALLRFKKIPKVVRFSLKDGSQE